jgi:Holliday junction resolvasome RuvABC endonuclease subunit
MITLALDLGTTTGFAIGNAGSIISGTWGLKPSRYDSSGMRFVKFAARLNEMYDSRPFGIVVYEEVRRHKGTDAAHIYGGLLAVLQSWCIDKGIPYTAVPVGVIKKSATGKGNAGKDEVLRAVRVMGFDPVDDNEADALALLMYRLGGGE